MTFFDDVRALNTLPVGDHMVAIPSGRAYLHGEKAYADSIHCIPFAEKAVRFDATTSCASPVDFYLGIGGPINMAHIALLKPRYAIFADINPFQTIYGRVMFSGIQRNNNPSSFAIFSHYCEQYILQHIRRDRAAITFSAKDSLTSHLYGIQGNDFTARLFREHKTPGAFFKIPSSAARIVANPVHYAYLRHMALTGRVGFLTLDVFDPVSLGQMETFIKSHLSAHNLLTRGAVYVSSLYSFLNTHTDWSGIRRKMMDEQALFRTFGKIYGSSGYIVADHAGLWQPGMFIQKLEERKSCRKKQVSEAEFGAVKLAPPSI